MAGLQDLSLAGDGLRVGALVRLADLARSPVVRGCLPLLAETAGRVGNVRVRNVATVGSLGPCFPPARLVGLAVKPPCAHALHG